MALNKKEQEILNQIEQELLKEDPELANTVKESTLSKYTRTRAVVSFFIFCFESRHGKNITIRHINMLTRFLFFYV